uniref:NADH:ubiquinone reductase (H(+)-translocating) n=1 Tax=Brentisentis yangtzensis TaxID=2604967 RepID=A0A5B9RFX6_9BILA|nr:NADH dehydrogenase subunit 5 [Brentisentis yangtzensis]
MFSVVVLGVIVLITISVLFMLSFLFGEGTGFLLSLDLLRVMNSFEGLGSLMMGGWSSSFILIVMSALSVIIGFTLIYLSHDLEMRGFQVLLLSFVLGMVVMLSFNSGLGVLVGWEILGVTSFMLIMYYCNRVSSGSSMMTILMNRWGDIGLVLFLMWWSVSGFSVWESSFGWGLSWAMSLPLVLCVVSKSAQFPLSGWLPMAMAAPTPVSALVHSSTLVVAGLVVMCLLMWVFSWMSLSVLLVLGCITLISSGLSALYEFDSKKVVALSTLFHLGVMTLMGCSVGLLLVLFHMILHAFYKSLCFIMVGWVIMISGHEQDLRSMTISGGTGGLIGLVMVSVVFNLVGLIYYSGWASKDILMEAGVLSSCNILIILVLLLAFSCSLGYSFNLISFGGEVVNQYGSISWKWSSSIINILVLILYTVLGVTLGVYVMSLGGFYLSYYVSSSIMKLFYLSVSLMILKFSMSWKSEVASSMLYLQDMYQVVIIKIMVWLKDILSGVEMVIDSVIEESAAFVFYLSSGVVDLVISWDLVFSIISLLFFMVLLV